MSSLGLYITLFLYCLKLLSQVTVSSMCLLFSPHPFLFFFLNRFFDMVNSITEEMGKTTEEGECDGDSLEVFVLFFLPTYKIMSF